MKHYRAKTPEFKRNATVLINSNNYPVNLPSLSITPGQPKDVCRNTLQKLRIFTEEFQTPHENRVILRPIKRKNLNLNDILTDRPYYRHLMTVRSVYEDNDKQKTINERIELQNWLITRLKSVKKS